MFKKYLLCALISFTYNSIASQNISTGFKTAQLYDLQVVAEKINRLQPPGHYRAAVPPFTTLKTADIQRFLAGIPSDKKEKRGRRTFILSMLDYIKKKWAIVFEENRIHKQITEKSREALIEIRQAINDAFKHDITAGSIHQEAKTFLQKSLRQKNNLIIRSSTKEPLFEAKSIYPVPADQVNKGIAQVLSSYFSEDTINEMISHGPLNPKLHLEVIIQSMIMHNQEHKNPVVSGVCCSYDKTSNVPNIVTIESTYGHNQGVKESSVASDTFYIHNDMVYPVIRKKINRLLPDFDMMHPRIIPNDPSLQSSSTLTAQTAKELARIALLFQEIYDKSICIHFVKRDNTIYLIKIQTPNLQNPTSPSSFDYLYTKKLNDDNKIPITPIIPFHELIVIKKRNKIILAQNVQSFLNLLKQREDDEIVLGIIKEKPGAWSKEIELLTETHKPVIWSPQFDTLRMWIEENNWPLIFDVQQKIAFSFKRCRGFCTLFQAIDNDVKNHPLKEQISTIPSFFPELINTERKQLKPDEFYSGVPFEHLFDLLKSGSYEAAIQSLNTILFRLKNLITHDEITKKECLLNEQTFDNEQLVKKKQQYNYIERVAYQLAQQLKKWDESKKQPADHLEKIFLINILHAIITQQPHDQIIQSNSFNQISHAQRSEN